MYLALLTDKRSRKIVGYHCGDTLEASGCLAALEMALANLPKGAKPIHHSDRGCQYCSSLKGSVLNNQTFLIDRNGLAPVEDNGCRANSEIEYPGAIYH